MDIVGEEEYFNRHGRIRRSPLKAVTKTRITKGWTTWCVYELCHWCRKRNVLTWLQLKVAKYSPILNGSVHPEYQDSQFKKEPNLKKSYISSSFWPFRTILSGEYPGWAPCGCTFNFCEWPLQLKENAVEWMKANPTGSVTVWIDHQWHFGNVTF